MPEVIVTAGDSVPWVNGHDVISLFAKEWRDNLGPAEEVDAVYKRYWQKTLLLDEETTRRIDLVRNEPGFYDVVPAYHDSVEESLFLRGEVQVNNEGLFTAGDYFWRPPGWVHAAITETGFKSILIVEGVSAGDDSGPASRRVRPKEDLGTNPLHSGDRSLGPRGWVKHLSSSLMPWEPGSTYARAQGMLDGFDLDHCSVKILSRNVHTGAQSLLMRLDPGYQQRRSGRYTSEINAVVTEGVVEYGGTALGEDSALRIPALASCDPLSSPDGAQLFVKVDGVLDFVI
jgi:hypothetical protein